MVGVHTLKVDMDDRRLQVNRGEDAIGIVTLKYVYCKPVEYPSRIVMYRQGVEFGTPKVCIKYHVSPQSYTGHIQSYYGKVTCLVSNEYFSFYSMYIDLLGELKTESKVGVG